MSIFTKIFGSTNKDSKDTDEFKDIKTENVVFTARLLRQNYLNQEEQEKREKEQEEKRRMERFSPENCADMLIPDSLLRNRILKAGQSGNSSFMLNLDSLVKNLHESSGLYLKTCSDSFQYNPEFSSKFLRQIRQNSLKYGDIITERYTFGDICFSFTTEQRKQ